VANKDSVKHSNIKKKPSYSQNGANGGITSSSNEFIIEAYRTMLRARLVDEKTIVLYKQNKCHFQIGVAGHEAVQAAAAKVFRAGKDWFYPYYRDMALCAGLGMSNEEFFLNAMNKQDDPNSHGRQMPMHYGHKQLRIVNQSSPTGTQFLQAIGCALACKLKKTNEVVYVSAGEGACAQGDFHEALNWAARDLLPVVFLIQNNKFAISVHVSEQLAGKSVFKLSRGYENLERFEVDGSDFQYSYDIIKNCHKRALDGLGPSLIEAHVPRLQSHSISDNQLKYRSAEEIKDDSENCPLLRMHEFILEKKILNKEELSKIRTEIKQEVDKAAEWAEAQPDCQPKDALTHIYIENNPKDAVIEGTATGEEIYMVDALNHALDEEMKLNPDMYIFGQDVAHGKGGVFTVTAGLTAKYGTNRVFNSQLAESSIVGSAIGMTTLGLKPVVEIQFGDYVWTAMMQIRNELATMNYRSGGEFSCPAVVRIAVGGYIHGGPYHSQNIEAYFAHVPGLFVVYPSNATDAKGLLKTAIRSKDPVLFLEHKGLYRQVYAKGPEGDVDCLVPIGKAKVVRQGDDITIVTWGAIVNKAVLAAKELEKENYSVEIIDIRTIAPLDIETIFESVKKTGRVLVAYEDTLFMGFGAEISAQIADSCFSYLDAPVKRIAAKNVPAIPHSPALEEEILPQNHEVLAAVRELLAF
jgi:2-oxoisovalerate dehydrogenase E1 component